MLGGATRCIICACQQLRAAKNVLFFFFFFSFFFGDCQPTGRRPHARDALHTLTMRSAASGGKRPRPAAAVRGGGGGVGGHPRGGAAGRRVGGAAAARPRLNEVISSEDSEDEDADEDDNAGGRGVNGGGGSGSDEEGAAPVETADERRLRIAQGLLSKYASEAAAEDDADAGAEGVTEAVALRLRGDAAQAAAGAFYRPLGAALLLAGGVPPSAVYFRRAHKVRWRHCAAAWPGGEMAGARPCLCCARPRRAFHHLSPTLSLSAALRDVRGRVG